MSERFLRNLRGVVHETTAALAGKPAVIFNVEIPNPAEAQEQPLLIHSAEPAAEPESNEPMSTQRARSMRLGRWANDWRDLSILGMKEESVDPKDVWVFVRCRGAGSPISFSTRWRETVIGVSSEEPGSGTIRCFVRFQDMQKLLDEQKGDLVEITATHFMYSTSIYRSEIPFATQLADSVVKPTDLPSGPWMTVRGAWRAVHEAFDFAMPKETFRGFSCVHVRPHHDGKNEASILGLSESMIYRRVVVVPGLTHRIAIPCKWAFLRPPDRKEEDALSFMAIGRSEAWVRFPDGIIVGQEMPQSAFPANVDEYFLEGLDGRIDFTVEEMRSLRRAVLALKPLLVEDGAGLGFTPHSSGITVRGAEVANNVAGRGDAGEEIILSKELLQKALTVQDLLSFEFKKGDPEYRVRFTGRNVSVVIASCRQPV